MQTPEGTVAERLDGLADAELRACCAADLWVEAVTAGQPYATLDALLDTSDAAVAALDDVALEQALSAHPRIGERASGHTREDNWSRTEQAGALTAGSDVTARLAADNVAYEERFDRVFLIRAAGRTAEQMYDELQARLGNDDDAERAVVLHELAAIVRLRLARLVTE